MPRIGRYDLSEISFRRLSSALEVRIAEIPHNLAWHFAPLARENKRRLEGFRDIHRGNRCFIVANGPSLAKTDLELLADEATFGLNRIYLHFGSTSFRPTYYVAMNELILEQFAGEIAELKMPKFLNWNRRSFYSAPDPELSFLKSRMVVKDSFQPDLTQPLVVGATVTFVALQLAFYMGFRQAVLIGLDHSYADKGIPSNTETRTADQDQSHFHPDYFPKGSRWQLPDLLRSEIDFEIARKVFEKDGRQVLDATIGGKCPVFEKVRYLSLFAGQERFE